MAIKAISAETLRIRKHLLLCGLSTSQTNSFLGHIHLWLRESGPEWTVSRLKAYKTWFIQGLASRRFAKGSNQFDYLPIWFKHKGNFPSGVFGTLFREGVNAKRTAKVLSALMCYTGFKSPKVTDKQYKKTIGSITVRDKSEVTDIESLDKFISSYSQDDWFVNHRLERSWTLLSIIDILDRQPIKYEFSFSGLNSSKPRGMFGRDWCGSFANSLSYMPVYKFLRDKFGFDQPIPVSSHWSPQDDRPGKISVIQERGFKARVVASPSAGVQVCLHPLHRALNNILKILPEDCTHNQWSGAVYAQDCLRMGHTVHSVDLSSATDNFPRSLQLSLLQRIGFSDEAHFINCISRDEWTLSDDFKHLCEDDYVQYSKGQPQGMYASFPLFGLTHNYVLSRLCEGLGIPRSEYDKTFPYRVLGDDVIISNDILHTAYRSLMGAMDVPISEDKCISSDTLSEFAGYVVTCNLLITPAKVPNEDWRNSFINYLSVVGLDGVDCLPSKVRPLARAVAELPQFYGGLGLNPKGKPFFVRVSNMEQKVKNIRLPVTTSIIPSLLKQKMVHPVLLDSACWLSVQDSRIQEDIAGKLPDSLRGMGSFTNLNEFLYQLVLNEDIAVDRSMSGLENRLSNTNQQNKVTELNQWNRKMPGLMSR